MYSLVENHAEPSVQPHVKVNTHACVLSRFQHGINLAFQNEWFFFLSKIPRTYFQKWTPLAPPTQLNAHEK